MKYAAHILFISLGLLTASLVSAQGSISLDIEAQRDATRGSVFSFKNVIWVVIIGMVAWGSIYFLGGGGGSERKAGGRGDKGGDDDK